MGSSLVLKYFPKSPYRYSQIYIVIKIFGDRMLQKAVVTFWTLCTNRNVCRLTCDSILTCWSSATKLSLSVFGSWGYRSCDILSWNETLKSWKLIDWNKTEITYELTIFTICKRSISSTLEIFWNHILCNIIQYYTSPLHFCKVEVYLSLHNSDVNVSVLLRLQEQGPK